MLHKHSHVQLLYITLKWAKKLFQENNAACIKHSLKISCFGQCKAAATCQSSQKGLSQFILVYRATYALCMMQQHLLTVGIILVGYHKEYTYEPQKKIGKIHT